MSMRSIGAASVAVVTAFASATADAQWAPPPHPPEAARGGSVVVTVDDERAPRAPLSSPPGDLRSLADEQLEVELAERRSGIHIGVEVGFLVYDTTQAFPSTYDDGPGWYVGLEAWHGVSARVELVGGVSLGDVPTTVQAFTVAADCYEGASAQRLAIAAGVRVRPWLRSTFHLGGGVHAGVTRATVAEGSSCNGETWAPLVGIGADTGIAFGPSNVLTLGLRVLVDRLSVNDDVTIAPAFPGGSPTAAESGMPPANVAMFYLAFSYPGR